MNAGSAPNPPDSAWSTASTAGAKSLAGKCMQRPIGIWISTVWSAIFAGVFPLVLMLVLYFGPAQGHKSISVTILCLSLILAASIILFAVGTWRPVRNARWYLAVSVTIHYFMLAYQNYNLSIAKDLLLPHAAEFYLGRAIRSAMTALVLAGYLSFAKTVRQFEAT
jgi:hypothetical protein